MDSISRIICESLRLRAYTVNSLETVNKLIKIHATSPNATAALGNTINATALAGATLKPDSNQTISVRFSGKGPLREVQAQIDGRGNIRGYVSNPVPEAAGDLNEINFSKVIGAGFLTVSRDLNLKEPYTSLTPILYGNIAADMSYFFTYSEQTPSAIVLALETNKDGLVTASGGILIQTFPDTPESSILLAEEAIANMPKSLGSSLLEGENINSVLATLINGHDIEVASVTPLQLRCRCSKDILRATLCGVQNDELEDMIQKDHGAEITCSFCRTVYRFNEDELKDILKEKTMIMN